MAHIEDQLPSSSSTFDLLGEGTALMVPLTASTDDISAPQVTIFNQSASPQRTLRSPLQ